MPSRRRTPSSKTSTSRRRTRGLPPLTGVPKNNVGNEVQSFIDSAVNDLTVQGEADGTFTIAPR